MPLASNARLGPYEIVSPLGAGGMGEVYRARDARLNRDVALKVLPEIFSDDAERMARFKREAQVLASLNHPNIAALYGLEESGVSGSGSVRALVMELAEGPTLAERMATRPDGRPGSAPIPLEEVLPIAKQIAEALEYAHEKGIIHRDLKPANVKITRQGTVKLLDFGLAKALDEDPAASDSRNSPTISMAATRMGVILGTAAYMAPEQAKGKPVDRRADIWAFGVVLYEMLTGRQLYGGESAAETLASVMKDEPKWDALPAETPETIRRLLRRCLDKDPRRRLQAIGEARVAIEEELTTPSRDGQGAAPAAPISRAAPARVWMASTAVLLLAAVSLAAVTVRHFRETPARQQTIRFQLPAPEKETVAELALSPDGERLAFTTGVNIDRRLWVRLLDSLTPQPLAGTEGAWQPFWSPDSRSIAFFAGNQLKKIDLLGGPPQTVCDAPNGWSGGAWNREGVILFSPWAGPLYRVSAAGGESHPATALDAFRQETRHTWVQFLPDGRHFLYTAVSSVAENSAVYAASLDSKESKRLLSNSLNTAYIRDASGQGYLLFTRADTLLAQRFDAARLELQGDPFPLAENLSFANVYNVPTGTRAEGRFAASDTSVLAYQRGSGTASKELVWFDRDGKRLSMVGEPADYSNPALSPDEKRLAVSRVDPQLNTRDIWIFDLARGASSRFTFDRADDSNPVWSPDGKRIAFYSERKGRRSPYIKDATGTGEEQALLEPGEADIPQDWSPDGRYLLLINRALPLEGDHKPVPLRHGGGTPQVSPDGRWLVYRSNESGRFEIYVQSFPGLLAGRSAGKWQVSTAGGNYPQWRRDGQELFYLAPGNKLMAVSVKTGGAAFEAGIPKPLFQVRVENANRRAHFLPASNGQRFLVVQVPEQAGSSPIDVVVNWAAGIKP